MITVAIYEPLWRCQYGAFDHYGEGLLDVDIWKREPEIESFSMKGDGFEITVKPKTGEIFADGTLALKTEPGKLIWMREMSVEINTHDLNTRSAPSCSFYRIGIGNVGFKIYPDGRGELWRH